VPKDVRVYAVGDIHGCVDQLDGLIAAIVNDSTCFVGKKYLIFLGDYVDRGPDSKGVIDYLLHRLPPEFSARFLKGNHEATLLDFLVNPDTYRAWRTYGAPETLLSYGVRPPLFEAQERLEEARAAFSAAIPADHLAFLRSLELHVVVGDYAFAHAGIRPGRTLEEQNESDLLWIRDDFLNSSATHPKVIVHGHTPTPRPLNLRNRIGIDTGVYATGVLSSLVLEESTRRFITVGEDELPSPEPAASSMG
jgi:serine/threonine protein phosphatase 1